MNNRNPYYIKCNVQVYVVLFSINSIFYIVFNNNELICMCQNTVPVLSYTTCLSTDTTDINIIVLHENTQIR